MPMTCPSCSKSNGDEAAACRYCGAELDAPPPVRPVSRGTSDAAKYGIIIGGLVVAVALILFFSGAMKSSDPCIQCRGEKIVKCDGCKGSGNAPCAACKGTGREEANSYSSCRSCDGGKRPPTGCKKCDGKGKRTCPTCKGTGLAKDCSA